MKIYSFFNQMFVVMCGFLFTHECEASVIPILTSPKDSLHLCNVAIGKVVSAPNKWGFKCTWYPDINNRGLTYRLSFELQTDFFKSMTVQEAGEMYAEAVEEYIKEINKIKIIRPFLKEFPITASSLDITMMLRDKNGKYLSPPQITTILAWEGINVEFCQETVPDPEQVRPYVIPVVKKSLSSISNKECFFSPQVLRTYDEKKPQVPTYTPYKSEINDFWTFILDCGHTLCKKHDLIYVVDGYVGDKNAQGFSLGYVLRGYQKLFLDDARKISADCAQYLFQRFQKNKLIKKYLRENAYPLRDNKSLTPESRHVSLRLSFWDEDINRRENPYIAEVRLIDNTFRYYTSDEGQRLVLVHEESFDDAVKFLEGSRSK